ncbi:MAG: bifunctional UDP-N-acetylglucosamine diphosphorylase/glucosamine-1-phosphate N-acetyltransferase GlmU [Chromatiales bacterium]|jgi:bifunctional UDP-N-acetylglucosamine pyrophosphorylase/glucosamine-1-phosphate N-acetyltransferase|nr:bifunctional UDP-N-acetylglucosamine diphosphorylase/glucosamine-1-phosphate N-acetyltransferase GlmU [Chromatiales bacterium]
MSLNVIILAAGAGKRMRSALPKVLHPLAGRPLVEHVFRAAHALAPDRIHVVHGHGGDQLRARFENSPWPLHWVEQAERLGTGHAVQQAMPHINAQDMALVLYGDVPLIRSETLTHLLELAAERGLALVTAKLPESFGYGRILRSKSGAIEGIVEEKDASDAERSIHEINTGILAARADVLARYLARLRNNNAQREYYLTDIVGMAAKDGIDIGSVSPHNEEEILGVNDRAQLARLERHYQLQQAEALMAQGVMLYDPARIDVRGELITGSDVIVDINVVFEGRVELGDKVSIGPNCVIRSARIAAGTQVAAHSIIEHADIGPDCRIGPFARIRPETQVEEGAHIGNFVEVKKSSVGRGSKINHLSYIGDAIVGSGVNIGAGTITCNYDGVNKHITRIGDGAFIGSDTQLVAPVTVGAGAVIGAGSTITRDAPSGELTLSRVPQQTRPGWKRPVKKERK